MYDITDILKKAITITEKRRDIYGKVLENTPDPKLRILIQIMMTRLTQDIHYYEKILLELEHEVVEPIDFGIYDMISSLINQFMRILVTPKCKDKRTFLDFVIDSEKAYLALLIDLQGRLAQSENNTKGQAYKIFSKVILHKRFSIQELENYKE